MRYTTVLLASVALVLVGCGASDSGASVETTVVAAATTEPAGVSTTSVAEEPTTTTSEPEGLDPAPTDPADLPGEVMDIYPYEGAGLAVVGVDRADVLNVRAGPGTNFAVLSELAPTKTGLIAEGHNRSVDSTFWVEVTVDGTTGWVNGQYVLHLGGTSDITAEVDPLPSGETMLDIGQRVGEQRASEETASRIVIIEDPVAGDLGEVTVDVIGFADDALGGERLHILASPGAGGEGFVVKSVERITLCSRGVTDSMCT